MFVVLIWASTFMGTPWSGFPVVTRVSHVGALVLGVSGLALAFYADLQVPIWPGASCRRS
jgi:hypothetical protein